MSTRAKWLVAIALLILVGLWFASLAQLRPLRSSQVSEVGHVT